MSARTVLVSEFFTPDSLSIIRTSLNAEVEKVNFSSLEEASSLRVEASALLIRSHTEVTQELLETLPNLRVIVTATTGFDHIDLRSCQKRQIPVMHTPEANVASAAELTWVLILQCLRHTQRARKSIDQRSWRESTPKGNTAQGKTLGIIGLGRIGGRVAELGRSFGMKVQAHDPYVEEERFENLQVKAGGLSEILRTSDILSLHVPLTRKTRHLINRETLQLLSQHAILINTSRGAVIDQNELTTALEQGHLAAVGLDVFEREPLNFESSLRHMERVHMTPHIGGYTEESHRMASMKAAEKLIAFLESGQITDGLPPKDAWYHED